MTRVGVLIDPQHPNHPTVLEQIRHGAQATGTSVTAIELRSVRDIKSVINTIQQERLSALIVPADPTFPIIHRQIAEFALNNRTPTMFGQKGGVEAGGLMSYAPIRSICTGERRHWLTRSSRAAGRRRYRWNFQLDFEFVINLKTAKALGLTVPPIAARERRRSHRVN